jgi:hypothetical protein
MKRRNLFALAFVIAGLFTKGQNLPTFDVTVGGSFVQTLQVGFKVHAFEKSQFGLSFGSNLGLIKQSNYRSVNLDHQLHFGKVSEYSKRSVWYFGQGLTYGIDNSDYAETKYLFFNLCLGREFNFSQHFGCNIDVGLFNTLMEHRRIKDITQAPWFDMTMKDFTVLPNARIQFFYSF